MMDYSEVLAEIVEEMKEMNVSFQDISDSLGGAHAVFSQEVLAVLQKKYWKLNGQ
jgi:cyanate lyase